MSKPLVLVTAPTVSAGAQKILRDAGGDVAFMKLPITEQDLLRECERAPIAAILLRGSPPLTGKIFEAAKDLKIVSKHGVGIDSVDLASATANGVAVMMANGGNADAVAEHSLALMLCVTRELPKFHRELRAGKWKDLNYNVRDFKARTVGIVGYGEIGRRTARLASACGATVVLHSRTRVDAPAGMEWEADLDALLARVDILSLHCPLSPKTRGLIGARELALMKPGSILVNTARGPVVDEAALIAALRSGHLAGAGIDTFAVEPVTPDNALLDLPNVICTPHIASSTTDSTLQLGTIASNNIVSWLRGDVYDPRNFVNPEVATSPASRVRVSQPDVPRRR